MIDALGRQYYKNDGVRNRECRQVGGSYPLSEEAIRSRLSDDLGDLHISCFETITSTNSVARLMVGGKLPCLITANAQTSGRGRRGKTFYSPHGVGLYFSLVFPWEREESAALVTTMAAVAVCRVLENEIGIVADIKWVNDIFLDGKKIGGILTEAIPVFDSENEKAIVLGIGINLERPEGGYPAELQERAGALSDVLDRSNVSTDMTAVFVDEQGNLVFNRSVLIAMMINELTKIVRVLPDRDYLDEYRERCFIIGKEIFLDDGRAIVPSGISDDGALMYRDENGQNRELISGEVILVRY